MARAEDNLPEKENGPAKADPSQVFLTIRSHEHQNNHREAIMSYGFKLSRP